MRLSTKLLLYEAKFASPLLFLGALNSVVAGSFRVFGKIKIYALIILLQTFLEIGLISFFVLSGYGLKCAVISLIITRIITLIILMLKNQIIRAIFVNYIQHKRTCPIGFYLFRLPLLENIEIRI